MMTAIVIPENDAIPPDRPGNSILYILSAPFDPKKPNSKYWLRCHKCGLTANLGEHEVDVQNGIINISPSILCPKDGCGNHYYIKNSEISY